jgi:hypothetical protein
MMGGGFFAVFHALTKALIFAHGIDHLLFDFQNAPLRLQKHLPKLRRADFSHCFFNVQQLRYQYCGTQQTTSLSTRIASTVGVIMPGLERSECDGRHVWTGKQKNARY